MPEAFTRESIAQYEQQAAAPVAAAEPVVEAEVPTPEAEIEQTPESSTEVAAVVPTEEEGDGLSGETVEASPTPGAADDGKPRSRAQERIEDLITERNAYRKWAELQEAKAKELEAAVAAKPAPPAVAQTVSSDKPPKLEDFNYDMDAFNAAHEKWIDERVAKTVQAELTKTQAATEQAKITAAFVEREAASRAAHPDYDAVTMKNPLFPKFQPGATKVLVRSELGTEVAYELGKNPALAAKFEKLDEAGQIATIGRIEGTIEARKASPAAAKTPPKKTVTKAPPPPTPLSGSKGAQKGPESMSMQEFVEHERQQKAAARTAIKNAKRALR
jgi:hypothetical protein